MIANISIRNEAFMWLVFILTKMMWQGKMIVMWELHLRTTLVSVGFRRWFFYTKQETQWVLPQSIAICWHHFQICSGAAPSWHWEAVHSSCSCFYKSNSWSVGELRYRWRYYIWATIIICSCWVNILLAIWVSDSTLAYLPQARLRF
jgi:hypothetical protein